MCGITARRSRPGAAGLGRSSHSCAGSSPSSAGRRLAQRRRPSPLLEPARPGCSPRRRRRRVGRRRRRAAERVAAIDALLRGVPGVQALLATASLTRPSTRICGELDADGRDVRATLDATRGRGRRRSEDVNAALVRLKDAVWAVRRDRLRTARAVGDLAGADAGPRGHRGVHLGAAWRCRRSTGSRSAAATRPGSPARARPRPRPRPTRRSRALLDSAPHDPLFGIGVGAHADGHARLRLQGGGRDRRARRQHRGAARGRSRRRPAAPAPLAGRRGRGDWCSATPAGRASGIISQPNAHPLELDEEARRDRTALRRRRAQRRRRQLRRPQGGRGLRIARRDHHRRQGHPDARVAAGWPRASSRDRGVPRARSPSFEGSVAIARQRREPRPITCCSPLRGSGQALYVGLAEDAYIVASEPYGVVEETDALPPHGRRDAGRPRRTRRQPRPGRSCSTAPAPARSRASRAWSTTARELPVDRRRASHVAQITTRDIDRGDVPALPAQGDQRGAGVVPQDAAGQARRARRPACRSALGDRHAARPTSRDRLRDGRDHAGAGHRPGHRGASPARASPHAARRLTDGHAGSRVEACRPPSCPASACAPT